MAATLRLEETWGTQSVMDKAGLRKGDLRKGISQVDPGGPEFLKDSAVPPSDFAKISDNLQNLGLEHRKANFYTLLHLLGISPQLFGD